MLRSQALLIRRAETSGIRVRGERLTLGIQRTQNWPRRAAETTISERQSSLLACQQEYPADIHHSSSHGDSLSVRRRSGRGSAHVC
jgi:hypothetical protein